MDILNFSLKYLTIVKFICMITRISGKSQAAATMSAASRTKKRTVSPSADRKRSGHENRLIVTYSLFWRMLKVIAAISVPSPRALLARRRAYGKRSA